MGPPGADGQRGLSGPRGDPGGGASYVRWGRTTCPAGTDLVYAGLAAGSRHSEKGGTSDTLCLQRTLNTGHTLPTHGQPSFMEWSMNSMAMHFQDICMTLTCRVPCATCPPGLLYSCNQQSTPVLEGGTRSTTGTSLVMLYIAAGEDARTPSVWI